MAIAHKGGIELAVPPVADRAEPFRSPLCERARGRSQEVERLAVEVRPACRGSGSGG